MTTPIAVHSPSLAALSASWQRHLRAANRSAATIRVYLAALRSLAAYLAETGMPTEPESITREHIESWLAHLLETRTTGTAAVFSAAARVFFAWLEEEGEIERTPMARIRNINVETPPPPVLTDEQIKALLATCKGSSFDERRDQAIMRLFLDTGMRRAELANIKLTDLDLDNGVAIVLGKGQRLRVCPFGRKTVAALDRYLRLRSRHPHADTEGLWLGRYGVLKPDGVARIAYKRAAQADIPNFHPHIFRHTFAHQWLASGGQEADLARLGG